MHRWYDSKTGRWISEDPIGFAAGDANLSGYVGNSPLGATDPLGLQWYDGPFLKNDDPYGDVSWGDFLPPRVTDGSADPIPPFPHSLRAFFMQASLQSELEKLERQHMNYGYYDALGLRGLFDKLIEAAGQVEKFRPVEKGEMPRWYRLSDTMYCDLPGTPRNILLHETVHAYDDIYGPNFTMFHFATDTIWGLADVAVGVDDKRFSLSRGEGLAYLVEWLAGHGRGSLSYNLAVFEDRIRTKGFEGTWEIDYEWHKLYHYYGKWEDVVVHVPGDPDRKADFNDLQMMKSVFGVSVGETIDWIHLVDYYSKLARDNGFNIQLQIPTNERFEDLLHRKQVREGLICE
ncbi:MAG: RHS repeat-associated core domain-containing protein [Pirellulaceae bacterium]